MSVHPSDGCAYCAHCGIKYPYGIVGCLVDSCGASLQRSMEAEPDANWREKVATRNGNELQASVPVDELWQHRRDRFAELGFPEFAACALADVLDALGFPLYWGDVDKTLKAGASHAEALRIFY